MTLKQKVMEMKKIASYNCIIELVSAVFINHMSMEVILKHMLLAFFVHASRTLFSK